MTQDIWTAVDDYLADRLLGDDPTLDAVVANCAAAGLPDIAVSPTHGKLLHLLARVAGARAILEIGTLGGYSAIWLARALPADGRLVTLEADPRHADVARANIGKAGLSDVAEIRLGPALETLPQLDGPFDMVFIDADKASYPDYFQWALRLSHPGTLIVADNVVRRGAVVDQSTQDANVRGVQRMHDLIAAEPRVQATALQTVGSRGYDGLALALVTG